ncbi:hypothetical protein, partial [Streptomyces sp. M2CJ-2]|uniref:hypothetical protein n=1 Tax=Streptomyces sp. M2CJ-2 TaxID=2803948 RepID=UPI001F33329B
MAENPKPPKSYKSSKSTADAGRQPPRRRVPGPAGPARPSARQRPGLFVGVVTQLDTQPGQR